MNTNNVVSEVFTDLQKGHFDKASHLLADNFHSNILGEEVNKSTYISTYRALLQGIPDMQFHVQDIKEENGRIMAKVLLSGTNSQPIPALLKGWRQVQPTHKKVQGLIAGLEVTVKENKIEEIKNQGKEKGLFINLLDHLGLDYRKLHAN